jgi:hypothetical protein
LSFYLYVWLVVDPRLIHQSIGTAIPYYPFSFHTGWEFLREHLARPGGMAEYGSRLLTQFYRFGWAGALIATASAWCAVFCSDALSRCAGRPRGHFWRYFPAGLLLMMCSAYNHPLRTILPLLAALLGFVLYVRMAPRTATKRLFVVVPAGAALYQVAGVGSLLFPAMTALYELSVGGRKGVAAGALLCGLAVPGTVGVLFGFDVWIAQARFLVFDPGIWAPHRSIYTLGLYLFFPAMLAATALRQGAPACFGHWRQTGASQGTEACLLRPQGAFVGTVFTVAAFLAVGTAAVLRFDSAAGTILEIDYLAQHEEWTKVLEAADRLPPQGIHVRSYRNTMLALHHTGLLGEAMFRYPRLPVEYLVASTEDFRDAGSKAQESQILLGLGQVNHAEAAAHDTLEVCGDLPAVLEELAVINVVKGRPATARIFLKALGKHLFFRATARGMLRRLEADPRLEDDSRVSMIRRNMLLKDNFTSRDAIEPYLEPLLERNPQNKMAFDFLMAHYLTAARPDQVVAGARRLEGFPARVPRLYQEAAVICNEASGSRRYGVDPDVLRRSREFLQITKSARSREDAARAAVEAGFGDSYFFYLMFHKSGLECNAIPAGRS